MKGGWVYPADSKTYCTGRISAPQNVGGQLNSNTCHSEKRSDDESAVEFHRLKSNSRSFAALRMTLNLGQQQFANRALGLYDYAPNNLPRLEFV
jgi:hypothetical protein